MEDVEIATRKIINSINTDLLRFIRRGNLLRTLVRDILVEESINHVKLPQEILYGAINSFYRQKNLNNKTARKKYLTSKGLTENDLHYQITIPLKVQKVSLEIFGSKAEAHFLENKEHLDQFIYNALRVDDSNLAYELYLQIESREADFTTLANKYSKDNDRFPGGTVGPRSLKNCHPLIRKIVQTSTPGVVKEPLKIEGDWMIIQLKEKIPAKLDNIMKKKLSKDLFKLFIEKKVDKIILEFT